jgi:hypothetical protein
LPQPLPLVRDPSHRKRLRHQDRPGASRPRRREDHNDLYARAIMLSLPSIPTPLPLRQNLCRCESTLGHS